jgi:hypothetical protein
MLTASYARELPPPLEALPDWTDEAGPQYHTAADPAWPNRARAIAAVAELLGMPVLPWVARALEVSTEYNAETDEPHRRSALWTVPRQSGKSIAVACVVIESMLRRPGSKGIYIAQTRKAGANRMREIAELLFSSGLDPSAKYTRGVGSERVEFSNGSRMDVGSPTHSSTHGESLDLVILDEVFDIDPIVLTAVSPAMAARPHAQMFMISTQGDDNSTLLNSLTEKGRADADGATSFVEYSMPLDMTMQDRHRWHEYHPGLGHTTTEKHLEAEQSLLSPPQWMRAYGNVRVDQDIKTIPGEWWTRAARAVAPEAGLVLAVDASIAGVSIAGSFPTGPEVFHVELIDHQNGGETNWVLPRLVTLIERLAPKAIVFDAVSPISPLAPSLADLAERTGLVLLEQGARARARSDLFLFGALRDAELTHNSAPALDAAAEKVQTEKAGDLWRFSRKMPKADPSPLIACSLALFAAHELSLEPTPGISWG